METKVCAGCGEEKSIDKFYKNCRKSDGLDRLCKSCESDRAKALRLKHTSIVDREYPKTKICSLCKEEKEASNFHFDSSTKNGLNAICKKCSSEYSKASRARRIEAFNNRQEEEKVDSSSTKICSKCGVEKTVSNFLFLKVGRYETICKVCKNVRERERTSKLRKKGFCVLCGKEKEDSSRARCSLCNEKVRANKKSQRFKEKMNAILYMGGKCNRCGLVSDIPDIYDFHHFEENGTKEGDVGLMLYTYGMKSSKVLAELQKCVMLCANCHRIVHWENKNGSAGLNYEEEV
jgi:hypothetical protein